MNRGQQSTQFMSYFLTHREFDYRSIVWTIVEKNALFEHTQKNQHRK